MEDKGKKIKNKKMVCLAGIIKDNTNKKLNIALLKKMLISLRKCNSRTTYNIITDSIAIGKIDFDFIKNNNSVIYDKKNEIYTFVDGIILDSEKEESFKENNEYSETNNQNKYTKLLKRYYKNNKENIFQNLNGSFNLVFWNDSKKELTIVNDCFGTRPIYYNNNKGFYFASEIKALLKLPYIKKNIDLSAIIDFFSFRHILGIKTFFSDIKLLPPASVLIYKNGKLTIKSYWEPEFNKNNKIFSVQDHAINLISILKNAVNNCLGVDNNVGFLLSGGIDSRLLLCLIDNKHFPLHTFTRGQKNCYDSLIAEKVAEKLGSHHHFEPIKADFLMKNANFGVWLTDGMMSCIDFYALSNAEQIKQYVDIICFGIPAGPLEGLGINYNFFDKNDYQLALKIYKSRAVYIQDWIQPIIFTEKFNKKIKNVAFDNLLKILSSMPFDESQDKAQYYFLRHYGPRSAVHGPILARSSVETCFPFADANLLKYIYKVPVNMRMKRKIEIAMLKYACPDMAKITWQYSGIPAYKSTYKRVRFHRALYRLKKELSLRTYGLIQFAQNREQVNWRGLFCNELYFWLKDILLSDRTIARGYYRKKGIQKLVDEHMSNRFDHSLKFGLLLTFEIWNRIFIDHEYP